ncbi:hypothetical protein ACFS5L_44530 [Streptomyces phyllanthi]|uniref:hypothetical protein n=1 Tax=Streptomyces phyllanthi TaxID=1803180 RepID=UPI001884050C|nr:hypothetical protein [Streptomyces phyllanthi]
MGDDWKQQDQYKTDLEEVNQQVGVVDATTAVSKMLSNMPFVGNVRFFGETDFEGRQLNDMINLVDAANPADLELAGKALWDARKAINEAVDELSGHIGRVDWEGEAGTAFRNWGGELVTWARGLADYADTAANQITAAGTGLASVRSAMPPRDTRPDPKKVEDIPAPKRVEGNAEYTAAVKAEKDRQEAINQMNRLSSFYAVSAQTLAGAPEPAPFKAMPSVGVPQPDGRSVGPGNGQESGSRTISSESTSTHDTAGGTAGTPRSGDTTPPLKEVDGSIKYPDRNVGTEIDSVDTLPPQTTSPAPGGTSQTTGTGGGTQGGTAGPLVNGAPPSTVGRAAGRTSAFGGGARTPISAQGRAGTPNSSAGGRSARGPMGPMGHANATGQTGVRGTGTPNSSAGGRSARGPMGPMGHANATGRTGARGTGGATAGRTPMGPAVSGGTPRTAGGTASGRPAGPGATGAGRGSGVVGGKPTTGATGPVPGATGSKVPRGTVIGGEGQVGSRATGGSIGQRGVIGVPQQPHGTGAGQGNRRSTSNPDGVVGAPSGRNSAARGGGATSGGSGLVRGPGASRRSPDRDRADREDPNRPDCPVDGQDGTPPDNRRRDAS